MRFFSLFLGLCLILPNVSMAACGTKHVSYQWTQDPDDDEYVYQFWGTYQNAKKFYEDGDKDFDITTSGYVWECDQEQGCREGTWLLMNNNSTHKGVHKKGPSLYRCDTTPDKCETKTLYDCYDEWGKKTTPSSNWKKVAAPKGTGAASLYPGAEFYEYSLTHYKLCVLRGDAAACAKDKYGVWNGKSCQCANTDNIIRSWNTKTKKCEVISGSEPAKTTTPAPDKKPTTSTPAPAKKTSGGGTGGGYRSGGGYSSGGGVSSSNTNSQNCTNSGGTWKNRKCSCNSNAYLTQSKDGKTCECTTGYERNAQNACVPTDETSCKGLGESVAKWENNQCVCLDTRQIYSLATKKCITNPEVTKCDKVADAKWTDGKCECIKQGYEIKDGKCVKGAALVSSEQKESRTKITSVYKKLNAMSGDFKVSVWKNADGNFNTARLASDSIAAVVLGTTGALVTSNIVKKNQVSGGFEDISCQVGGQTVAGWGDQFSVGIQ